MARPGRLGARHEWVEREAGGYPTAAQGAGHEVIAEPQPALGRRAPGEPERAALAAAEEVPDPAADPDAGDERDASKLEGAAPRQAVGAAARAAAAREVG